jgi:hypothetical protein
VSDSPSNSFADQAAKAAKAKAFKDDYDSEEETKEEWEARYERELAEEKAKATKKLEAAKASAKGFSFSGSSAPAKAAPASKPSQKPTTGSSSQVNSGGASPAQSVFETSSAAPSPGENPFSFLSSAASSNHQDDEGDETEEDEENQADDERDESRSSVSKRQSAEAEETSEESSTKPAPRPSLQSRISRGPPTEQGSREGSVTPKPNGNGAYETPQKTPFAFFDFGKAGSEAGSQTAPPKPHGGDNTYKPDTPIKFSTPDPKSTGPLFSFQSATPTSADSAPKPASGIFANLGGSKPSSNPFAAANAGDKPATSIFGTPSASKPGAFSFLTPNAGQPGGILSTPSSSFPSRATTPLSDGAAATEKKDSKDADADEDAADKGPTLDFSSLTEDEQSTYDVLFHNADVLAKHQAIIPHPTDKSAPPTKEWKNLAHGPLWILKPKDGGKVLVRMRIPNGKTPVNYNLLPGIRTGVAGKSKTMVSATRPKEEGKGLEPLFFVFNKMPEQAKEFSETYNANLPEA